MTRPQPSHHQTVYLGVGIAKTLLCHVWQIIITHPNPKSVSGYTFMKDTAYIFLFILFLICLVTSIVLFILQIPSLPNFAIDTPFLKFLAIGFAVFVILVIPFIFFKNRN